MGNSNCSNAVPCLGSEGGQNSPDTLGGRSGKRGVIAKNRRAQQNETNKRSIDNFLMESRDMGHSMQSLRSTEHMMSYGMHTMVDETGMPSHYLLDTVGDSSSNADSGSDSH